MEKLFGVVLVVIGLVLLPFVIGIPFLIQGCRLLSR
jgi:hypothetical protein